MSVESLKEILAPLRKSLTVSGAPGTVFARFIERLDAWWPRDKGYSVYGAESARCHVEPFVGGTIYEESRTGARAVWGVIQQWEPPERVAFSWHPGRAADTAQTVEVSFTPVAEGVRIDLEHRDWHRLGAPATDAREAYTSYDAGWNLVLGAFSAHLARAPANAPI